MPGLFLNGSKFSVSKAFRRFFKGASPRQLGTMFAGNVLISVGISLFMLAGLGTDPFNSMVTAFSGLSGIAYADLFVLASLALFIVQLAFGRRLIGPGTLVNMLLLGYMATFFLGLWQAVGVPGSFLASLAVVAGGVGVGSFGVALYQSANAGVAPYDSLPLMITKRFPKVRYSWCRMVLDGLCVGACLSAGGTVGLGTLAIVVGFGPCIQLFSRMLAKEAKDGEENRGKRAVGLPRLRNVAAGRR